MLVRICVQFELFLSVSYQYQNAVQVFYYFIVIFVSVGSDVNSMDSVDSGCTMGNGDNQSNHAASLSSELVIWEIEVPKVSQRGKKSFPVVGMGQ